MSLAYLSLLSKQLACDERSNLVERGVYFFLMEMNIEDIRGLI